MSYKPKAQVIYCGASECVFNSQQKQKTNEHFCTRATIQINVQSQCQHYKQVEGNKK